MGLDLDRFRKTLASWEENTVKKALKDSPERKPVFKTTSDIEMKRVYTPLDAPEGKYEEDIGLPGVFPFTRGVQPTAHRGRLWTMRQYAGFGTAEESNRRYRYLLEHGQTGLSIAFDLPTQLGFDSDSPRAAGEVGRVGVAISSLRDMEILFDGIPLDKVSTSMTINATASILLALYIAVAEKQGVAPAKLNGTIQNDILKEYVARGNYIYPPKPSMRIITDIFAYCKESLSRWNTISISGYHIRDAGSTAVQELAFTLADGIAYVEAAIRAGLEVDDFASRISFFFNCQNDFLEEIAKFRAARRLWARIMKDRFHAKKDRSCMLRYHVQTGGATLTAQQPDNNIVRVTIQALAAVLGGTQSLHTCSRDEALALPTEDSVRIALRTQQILAHESGVASTVDPLAGSYVIEALTDELEARAIDYIRRIDEMGGAVVAIEKGFMQQEIQDAAYRYQMAIEKKEQIIVGLNEYRMEAEKIPETLKMDPTLERFQIGKLVEVKSKRDGKAVAGALAKLEEAARGTENLMPRILDAVKIYATLGEISDVMRRVFGEYEEKVVV